MHDLNPKIDLTLLKNRKVVQIAVGLFQVQFGFDEDVRISVEGGFSYFDGKAESAWKPEPGCSSVAAATVGLLGAVITKFEAHENGTLKLEFSNGRQLTIPDSSKEYESYSITRPGFNLYV